MPITLEPITITAGEDDEARRQREAEARRLIDEQATQEALRALQQSAAAPPPALAPGTAADAEAQARGAPSSRPPEPSAEPYRGETRTPWSQQPGATVHPSGAVAFSGGLPLPERAQRIEDDRVAAGRPPIGRPVAPVEAAPPRRRPSMPDAAPQMGNPVAGALDAVRGVQSRREEEGVEAASLERWDRRIQAVERMYAQERDQRRRAVLGSILGNLLMGAARFMAGARRPAAPITPRFDAFEERLRQRLQDSAREWDATDRATLGALERRDTQQARDARLDVQRGQLDIARLREARAAETADAQRQLSEARTAREQIEARQRLSAVQVDSEDSRRARSRYALEEVPRRMQLERGRSRDEIREEVAREVEGMSAYDIEQMESRLPHMSIGARTSRAGGGGGGGRVDRAALEAEAMRLGLPEAAARAMRPQDLQRELATRTRRGQGAGGEELLPGVRAGIDLSPGEGRAFRRDFAEMRSQYGALGEIERISSQYGASAIIDRRAAGEMAAPITRLRAMVARLQNTGVINPSEAPAIEAMLPNPSSLSQMTFGDLQARLHSFRGELERAVESELASRDVDAQGMEAARQLLRGRRHEAAPRSDADAGASGERFRVSRGEQSSERPLTPEQAERLEAAGFTVEPL